MVSFIIIISSIFLKVLEKMIREKERKRLKNFISTNNLEDSWRLLFPTTRDYAYYSQSMKN